MNSLSNVIYYLRLAKDIFHRLCTRQPEYRYSATEALRHPWITRNFDDPIIMNYNEYEYNDFLERNFVNALNAIFFSSLTKIPVCDTLAKNVKSIKIMNKFTKACTHKKIPCNESSPKASLSQIKLKPLNISNNFSQISSLRNSPDIKPIKLLPSHIVSELRSPKRRFTFFMATKFDSFLEPLSTNEESESPKIGNFKELNTGKKKKKHGRKIIKTKLNLAKEGTVKKQRKLKKKGSIRNIVNHIAFK